MLQRVLDWLVASSVDLKVEGVGIFEFGCSNVSFCNVNLVGILHGVRK